MHFEDVLGVAEFVAVVVFVVWVVEPDGFAEEVLFSTSVAPSTGTY